MTEKYPYRNNRSIPFQKLLKLNYLYMNIVFSYINLFGNYIFQNWFRRDVNGEKKNFGKQRGGRAKVERARHSGNSLPTSKVKYRHE